MAVQLCPPVRNIGIVENQGSYFGYHVVYYQGENPDIFKWMVVAEFSLVREDTQTWLEKLKSDCTEEQADGIRYLG